MPKRIIPHFQVFSVLFLCGLLLFSSQTTAQERPNILFIFIDDMGYGDLGCYGNEEVHTPHIDQLAAEGIKFTRFYVNSPICSPSRAAVITDQYPSRWGITSFIHDKKSNRERGMEDYLSLEAPSFPRELQQAGYYTAHIGKWHMGGGRDIDYAPLITEYGFDESVTQFEGLGERYLAVYETFDRWENGIRFLERMSSELGKGEVHWAKRENFTRIFVDRTIQAMETARKANKPFYINLWPDDIHTPLEPPKPLRGDLSTKARFLGVMQEMDRQMGRLFGYIRSHPGLGRNTLIVLTSDNGPDKNVNAAGHLRGYKTQLYEGGIREPFIIWGPGLIPAGKSGSTDDQSVIAAIDLAPGFMAIAGVSPPAEAACDGLDKSEVLLGKPHKKREHPLFWLRPPDRPGYDGANEPDLAIRQGKYKLLMDVDGSNAQLYNLKKDEAESHNLAAGRQAKTAQLKKKLLDWYRHYPHRIDRRLYREGLD